MVEIATAFSQVAQPVKLVILDEPTSSLDATLATQLLGYVRSFVETGGSVIFISHILGEILSTSDRIVVMKDGKVVDRSTCRRIRRAQPGRGDGERGEGSRSRKARQGHRRTARRSCRSRRVAARVFPLRPFLVKLSVLPAWVATARPIR